MGVIHDDNESCFFKGSEGYCEEKIEGTTEAYEVPKDTNDSGKKSNDITKPTK